MNDFLLSICIPTYNRALFLDIALTKIHEQLNQIQDRVELIISDNCSTDNTADIVQKHVDNKLSLRYIRNETNLGMDGNFIQCFNMAKGQYLWLLGDDDFLKEGALFKILNTLRDKDYGLVHLQSTIKENSNFSSEYSNYSKFLNSISFWITFISGNIVNTKYIENVNFEKYHGTFISQVPLFLEAATNSKNNLLIHEHLLEVAADGESNGGYNFFQVFVSNYLNIWSEFVHRDVITVYCFEKEKRSLFHYFILRYTYKLLIIDKLGNFDKKGGWEILCHWYGKYLYFYRGIIILYAKNLLKRLKIRNND